MQILILGGTAWLGQELARQALARGHDVTCLARGKTGTAPAGATFVKADRGDPTGYAPVTGRSWDAVLDLTRQPGLARTALEALKDHAAHWTFVSTISVYASHADPGADESAPVLEATDLLEADMNLYGEAKVACEQAARDALGERLLLVRPGLIGGPGDASGRSGYWVARAARDTEGPLLAPAAQEVPTQAVDARDLASWLLDCMEERRTGTYDAVGPQVPFAQWLQTSRQVAGHTGPVVTAGTQWLLDQGVGEYMGPESMAMWAVDASLAGWSTRTGTAAHTAGLRHRPRADMLADTLAWEREQGLGRARRSGLSASREDALLNALHQNVLHQKPSPSKRKPPAADPDRQLATGGGNLSP